MRGSRDKPEDLTMRHGGGRSTAWAWNPLNSLYRISGYSRSKMQRKNACKSEDQDVEGQELLKYFNSGQLVRGRQGGTGGYVLGGSEFNASSRKCGFFCYNPVAAVLILTVLWIYLYSESLVGGDLQTVVHLLGHIAACFFSGIACFFAAICITIFSPNIRRRLRAVLLGIIISPWILVVVIDHGGSLRHHGAYNLLVLAVTVVPALLIAALEYGAWRLMGTKKLVSVHLPIAVIGAIATNISLHNATAAWDRGFRGEHMLPFKDQTVCTPVNRGLPWVDIFPEGTQNFWAGRLSCGDSKFRAKSLGFFVNFSSYGALSMTCNAGIGMTYTPFPSTLNWPKDDKLVEETYEGKLNRPFNKNVMDKVREAGEIPYEVLKPVLLPDGVEAVIVRCGDIEQIVTRVRPNANALSRTRLVPEKASTNVSSSKLDVVFLFLDATSRRGFHRRLQHSVSVLEEADAKGLTRLYQFFRYNVVKFATEPNSKAMFQGTFERHREAVPPIWEDYAASGWVTLNTADTCQDLAAAYMNRWSNHDQPSFDHELLAPFCHSEYFTEDANPFGNFKGPYSICTRCLKGQQVHEYVLNYLESFQDVYSDRAKFSLAWLMEGHEGTTEILRLLDDDLAAYLKRFAAQDWNRTALVIAADHGLHMGLNFGLSQIGAVEHKNPFMAVMLPPWFADQESRQELITKNQQRMVTGLDLYRTLQGIRMAGLSDTERERWVDNAENHRLKSGIDLLHQEVPEGRTCKDAAIPQDYCQCL